MDLVGISLSRGRSLRSHSKQLASPMLPAALFLTPRSRAATVSCSLLSVLALSETLMTAISCDRLLPCHLPESLDFVACLTVALGSKLYSASQRLNVLQTTTMTLYRTHLYVVQHSPPQAADLPVDLTDSPS